MSLLSGLKAGLRTIGNWLGLNNSDNVYETTVSNDVNEDIGKQTLNEQINNGNISLSGNNTNNVNSQVLNDEPSGIDSLKDKYNSQASVLDTTNQTTLNTEPLTSQDEDDNYSFWNLIFKPEVENIQEEKEKDWEDSFNDWVDNLLISQQAKAEYEEGEKFDAIGYDEDSGNVLYLDLNDDRGLFDADWGSRKGTTDLYNTYLSEFLMETDRPGVTDEEYTLAWQNFYDKAKTLFRIRGDDYYSNGLFGGIKRRKNMYTEDELSTLASNNKSTGRYEPTPEEFRDFVMMKLDNDNALLDIQKNYGLLSNEDDTESAIFDVSGGFGGGWMAEMRDIALQNVDEYLAPAQEVNPNAAQEALLTYSSTVLGDQLPRYYQRVAPVYRYEREIRSRDQSTRTDEDRRLLDTAAKFREMDKAFASGLNNWFRQVLLYGTNQKGDIVNSIDIFENGESLSDVLTNDLKKISGIDWKLEEHQSALDIVSKMANDAIYHYRQDKVKNPSQKIWNRLEHGLAPAGDWLGETGQFLVGTSMDTINDYVMGHDSLTSDYLDQDFTIGRLIETDDGNIKRTIKKYALEGAEYTPEILGNLLPDLVITVASGGAGGGTFARHITDIKRTYDAIKAAKGASFLTKTGVFLRSLTPIALRSSNYINYAERLGLTMEKLHELGIGVRGASKTTQTLKTAAQLADKFITDFGLGQLMDAQWSAYDTEPYSKASFLWSVLPSVAFDAFPHLFRAATGRGRFKWGTGMDQGSVWSLAKYIDSSPEAAENVARALGKSASDINLEDLKLFAKNYSDIEEAAKIVYNKQLTNEERAAIGKMTKQLAYNYVNQAFGGNSITAKRIRAILSNGSTNIADVVKYLGRIPGEVSMGPFVSTIKFKNGTEAIISEAAGKRVAYSPVLDAIFDGGFDSRVKNGFSQADIDELSTVKGYYSVKDNKSKFFNKVVDDKGEVTYFLNEDGLNRFGLKGDSLTLESLGVTLAEAEKTREILKTKLKGLDGVKISDGTIGELADTGGYNEVVSKVKELLGC